MLRRVSFPRHCGRTTQTHIYTNTGKREVLYSSLQYARTHRLENLSPRVAMTAAAVAADRSQPGERRLLLLLLLSSAMIARARRRPTASGESILSPPWRLKNPRPPRPANARARARQSDVCARLYVEGGGEIRRRRHRRYGRIRF